jgi:sodium transport system permease protein
MHPSIIQLICRRELRDLLRDRRTMFMVFVLPLALYPLLGVVGFLFALKEITHESKVGIYGAEHLPQAQATSAGVSPLPAAAWFSLTPVGPFAPSAGTERVLGAAAFAAASNSRLDYPPLILAGTFSPAYADTLLEGRIRVVPLPSGDRGPVDAGAVDVLLVVPPDLLSRLEAGEQARFEIYYREGDSQSRLADRRLDGVLRKWSQKVRQQRFLRSGLPADYDQPVQVRRPQEPSPSMTKQIGYELKDMLAKSFPLLLIMWALAGALHPAIDLTAGEKERGTLETLVLSPASRGEIVCGKFLAVWCFSAVTALWNLAWIGGAACLAGQFIPDLEIMSVSALAWSAVLAILMAALFSALSIALGAYARSTKEGQIYLLPVFIVTMPLILLSMAPGVTLDWFYSLVPITGACLLMQKLMAAQPDPAVWVYFLPVLASLVVCCALSLRWAVAQFRREDVLFRDSAGISFTAALRRLFTRSDAVASP